MAHLSTLEYASATITIDAAGEVTEGETVVVAGKTYTFNATLGADDGDVDLGADADGHRANLTAAINLGAGSGTAYAAAMTRNPHVHAVDDGVDTITLYALIPGAIGNLIPLTAGTSGVTVSGALLTNGAGHIGDWFDDLFATNQISSELVDALRQFSVVEGGALDGVIGS
jgi:hypothetical protein